MSRPNIGGLERAMDIEITRCERRLEKITPRARALVQEVKALKDRIEQLRSLRSTVGAAPIPTPMVDNPTPSLVRGDRNDAILELLRVEDRWMAPREIAEELGVTVAQIRDSLTELARADKIASRGHTVDRAYLIVREAEASA